MVVYLVAAELISAKKSKGEILVFRRAHGHAPRGRVGRDDVQTANEKPVVVDKLRQVQSTHIERQTAVFHWRDVCFDLKINSKNKRILDRVDGWVAPGTLTALMV